jgi:hypothetical protein
MSLTQRTMHELRSELANLQRQRGVIDAGIQGIEAILVLRSGGGAAMRLTSERSRTGELAIVETWEKGRRVSLRSRVIEMLRGTSGLKTADVVNRLDHEGYRVGGVTTLSSRVSHELSRLRRMKLLKKRSSGRYVLMAEAASDTVKASSKKVSSKLSEGPAGDDLVGVE